MDKIAAYVAHLKTFNVHTNIYSQSAYASLDWHIEGSVGLGQWLADDDGPVIDFGSGCGLPIVPLAISMPNRPMVAIESKSRKTRFLTQVAHELDLRNLTVVTQDIAEWAKKNPVIGTVTAKAFKPLPDLVGYMRRQQLAPRQLLVPASRASWLTWQPVLHDPPGIWHFHEWGDRQGVIRGQFF